MVKILLYFCIFNSSLITISTHPISLGIILLLQTLTISYIMRILTQSSWLPFTLFLVMVGGLMIIFMYISSICSNKKPNFIFLSMSQMIYFILSIFFLSYFMNMNSFYESLAIKNLFSMEFTKLFLPLNLLSSNFMFLYLLLMLIIMIEILSLNKGPMRKKY